MNVIPLNEALAEPMCELWNRELGDLFPMRQQLFVQNSFQDVNVYFPGSWIAQDSDGSILGFIIAKKWQETVREMKLGEGGGWIQALVVRSDERGKGIGSELLTRAEQALREAGASQVFIGRDPWHYVPGFPKALSMHRPWLEKRGFKQLYEVSDMLSSEETELLTAPDFADGAVIKLLEPDDKEEMLKFFRRCFPGRWLYEAQCYWERGGQGREFIGLFQGSEMIGFCRVNDEHSPLIAQNTYWAPLFDEPLGGIGPLGVDDQYRGKGYGLGLVKAGIAELQQRGMRQLVIDWTELVDFYAKLGFHTWKRYDLMSKAL